MFKTVNTIKEGKKKRKRKEKNKSTDNLFVPVYPFIYNPYSTFDLGNKKIRRVYCVKISVLFWFNFFFLILFSFPLSFSLSWFFSLFSLSFFFPQELFQSKSEHAWCSRFCSIKCQHENTKKRHHPWLV